MFIPPYLKEFPCKTKIACTIGPSSCSYETLKELVNGGMSLARLNLSHCSHEFVCQVLSNLRAYLAETKMTTQVGTLLDLNGGKLRTGKLHDGKPVKLQSGDVFCFNVSDPAFIGDKNGVYATMPFDMLTSNDRIYVDDGLLEFTVVKLIHNENEQIIECIVNNNGILGERKGINVPSYSPNKFVGLSALDVADVRFGMEQNVDFITLSCIRSEREIMEVRKILGNSKVKVLSKIENKAGLENFDNILKVSDGIIIDRGYLCVEIDLTTIAIVQKDIIQRCQLAGKPVLLANEILESMNNFPRPTRSETSDVTSAVDDGTDALILSAETAVGLYPVESLYWLRKICYAAEVHVDYQEAQLSIMRMIKKPVGISESIACSAVKCAREISASCIIVYTEAGGTARLVAKYRPTVPVIATTDSQFTARQLSISFGLISFYDPDNYSNEQEALRRAAVFAQKLGFARPGDQSVITTGQIAGFLEGTTTTMRVMTIQ